MLTRETYFQYFKYSIYILLTFNFYFFFIEDVAALSIRFPDGVQLDQIINAYATSIDTVAWLILVWILELETYILEEDQITPVMEYTSLTIRAICYGFIIYAFFGYCSALLFYYDTNLLQEIDLCSFSTENCSFLSTSNEFLRFGSTSAIADISGAKDIIWLGWIDVINSGVWILVVLIIELNIRLQEKNIKKNLSLKLSNFNQYILYPILFINAFYWGLEGDFVDFWDAFLWLVAFIFIELNIIQWRDENTEQV
jgi:hypothetical protein